MTIRNRARSADQRARLTAVRRVAKQRQKANAGYVAAIVAARESGLTYAAIAEAVGTSSQAVQEIVRRHRDTVTAVEGGAAV